jgi:hypothetical protein
MSRTIVMIHGMFGSSWCWDHYRTFFEGRGYTCLTPVLVRSDHPRLRQPQNSPQIPAHGDGGIRQYAPREGT